MVKKSICHRRGYSFVELMVAVSILGIIVVTFSRLFMTALLAEKKARNLEQIKRNGNYVLSVLADEIRNARQITSCTGSATNSLTIENQDGITTTPSCASNVISSGVNYLIDNTAITISDCNIFTCERTLNNPDVVKVSFSLSMGDAADPKEYVEQNFLTTVSLRTY